MAILPDESKQQLIETLAEVRQSGVKVVVDSNYRPRLWDNPAHAQHWLTRLYQQADIALITLDDEALLHETTDMSIAQVQAKLVQCGVTTQVIKLGKNGAFWSYQQGQEVCSALVPTKPVSNVVDTTAAGDSFNAGFLAGCLAGLNLTQCCEWGNAVAGEVIQHQGAIIPHSKIEELKQRMEVNVS